MIRTFKGETRIYGEKSDVLTDLSMIVDALNRNTRISKSEIMEAVEYGFMEGDQLEKAALEKIMKVILGGK